MKHERANYGAENKSSLQQWICGSASISCNVRKTGPIFPPLVGLTAGRQTGRQAGRQNMGGF